jgi:hypothetical protein
VKVQGAGPEAQPDLSVKDRRSAIGASAAGHAKAVPTVRHLTLLPENQGSRKGGPHSETPHSVIREPGVTPRGPPQ